MAARLAVLALLALFALATTARADAPDYAKLFAGRDACFELVDVATAKLVERYDAPRCAVRTSPCSTFKVPLALMAFDAGILEDETSSMRWDGKDHGRASWNRDQTAASWMRDSVVWFSQRLTPKLGLARVRQYLARFDYGNQDFSGGVTTAWLGSSLEISPDEQVSFWRRWWRGELEVSRRADELTRRITLVDASPAGGTLHGKTGSCNLPKTPGRYLGWYVGHVGRGERSYVFVVSYTDRDPPTDHRPPGFIARELALRILGTLGMYSPP